MPKGIILVGWDNQLGSIIEAKYPEKMPINEEQITKYLSTIQMLSYHPIFQIHEGNEIILLYGAPTSISKDNRPFAYDFLALVLDEIEQKNLDKFQMLLSSKGELILKQKINRKMLFQDLISELFQPKAQKIVFMGFPNAGKTSTKLFLFEKMNEDQLLQTSLKPTEGVDTSQYNFMDLNISLFDTSGQELERWYDESENVLISSELVIFFFSVTNWLEKKVTVQEYITRLIVLRQLQNIEIHNIIIFCHKIDLIEKEIAPFKEEIISFVKKYHIPVFFTSIKEGGNQDLVLGIQLIIEKFSSVFNQWNQLLTPLLKLTKISPLLIYDKNNRLICDYTKEISKELKDIDLQKIELLNSGVNLAYQKAFNTDLKRNIIYVDQLKKWIFGLYIGNVISDFSILYFLCNDLINIEYFLKGYLDLFHVHELHK